MRNKYSTSAELRTKARVALRDRWVIAVVAVLIVGFFNFSITYDFSADWEDTEDAAMNESLQAFEYNVNQYAEDGDIEGLMEYLFTEDFIWVLILVSLLVALVALLFSIFVGIPVMMGYYRFNHDLFQKRKTVTLGALFAMFRRGYWRSIGVNIRVDLILIGTSLLGVLFFFLSVFVGALLAAATSLAFFFAFGRLIGWALLVIYLVKVLLKSLSYAMVPHILVDHPDMGGREILERSKNLMKGNKWRYVELALSFIGWFVGAILLTCGLGLFPVMAYAYAAETAFYRELVRGGKRPHLLAMMKNR